MMGPSVAMIFRCVVDTCYILQHLDGQPSEGKGINETTQQLAFADLVLLNKIDLASPAQVAAVKGVVRSINNSARIIEARLNMPEGRPPVEAVLRTSGFSLDKALLVSRWQHAHAELPCSSQFWQ